MIHMKDIESTGLSRGEIQALDDLNGSHPGFRLAHGKGILLSGVFTPSPYGSSLIPATHLRLFTPVSVRFSDHTDVPTVPDNAPKLDTFHNLSAKAHNLSTKIAAPLGALMGPLIAVALAFAAWSLMANMRYTALFLWTTGPFASWMIWLAMALILHLASIRLSRVQPDDRTAPDQDSNGLERFFTEMKNRNEQALVGNLSPAQTEEDSYWTRDAA